MIYLKLISSKQTYSEQPDNLVHYAFLAGNLIQDKMYIEECKGPLCTKIYNSQFLLGNKEYNQKKVNNQV